MIGMTQIWSFKCLKKDSTVLFKLCNSDEWHTETLKSRSGKVTGKYKNAWNTIANDGTENQLISTEMCKSTKSNKKEKILILMKFISLRRN